VDQSNIAGVSGSITLVIVGKQDLDGLPDSPRDAMGNVDYNYSVYLWADPIDVQMNFPADGVLTQGADGNFKFQGLMFFFRKINGQIELYNGS
jgi:hypothetical protein